MLKTLLRAVVGGVIAGLLTAVVSHYLLQPDRAAERRADDSRPSDDLSEAQQEQLLRELGSLT